MYSLYLVLLTYLTAWVVLVFFSSVDLATAYHQIRIKQGHEHQTAFVMPQGLYEWIVMLLGLTNAPAMFQHIMNLTFIDMLHKCMCVYLDDILVFSEMEQQSLHDLCTVLERLRHKTFMPSDESMSLENAV